MASSYSTSLKLELMSTGENSGTWGNITNTNLGTALEQSIVGKADITMSSTTITLTLTNTNAAQDARAFYLNLTGTPGGAAMLEVPAVQKPYLVKNGTTGGFAVTIKVSGQTGVVVPNGKTVWVYNNGTDVVTAIDHIPSLTLGTALPVASGGIGTTTLTANNVLLGNGASAPQVVAPGSNGNVLTSNGTTWISSAPAASVSSFSAGTTGFTPNTGTTGAVTLAGTLNVANGGTGATTLTANNVIIGNGTSAVNFVAPGTSGNVLTSNGTTWTSTAPAPSGVSKGQSIAFAMIFGL
jgi:hypothetical protein